MICTTIQNKNLAQIAQALEGCEMAEIRLDRCDLSLKDIEECFTSDVPLVATCRLADLMATEPSLQDESLTPQSREIKAAQIAEKRLCKAIEAGARYVDVEIEAPKQMSKRVRNVAHESGTVFIRSYHNFEGTDSLEALKAIVEKCFYHGADLVKVVTVAHGPEDVERVMSLYESADANLIAFCMGEAGRASRVECLRRGAPYTYAALSEAEAAAPGQMATEDMKAAVYGDYRFISPATAFSMPASKSFAQRAIIAAALADGVSHLRGYTPCGDSEAAIQVAQKLGAEVEKKGSELVIKGISASLGSLEQDLHVGESGLLTRMMIPLMAQLCEGPVQITGEKTLLNRPLTGAREIMEAFGASVASASSAVASADSSVDSSAEVEPVRVPLTVQGPLAATRAEVSGKHGSQIISGLLMALPFSQKNTSLIVREPKSIPYMFITVEVLKKFGIKVGNDMLGGRDFIESGGDWSLCTEIVFKVKGGQKYKAADIDLEGDWSAAANFLVAGALFGKLQMQGLDTTSLQADLSIMDILMDAGASLSQLVGDRGDITVQRAPLQAVGVEASNCPDLFPIISVLAAFCQGTSRIAGVGRLANKESDRAKAIVDMLTQMGVTTCVEGDELVIEGHSLAQRLLNRAAAAGPGPVAGSVAGSGPAAGPVAGPASVAGSVSAAGPGLLRGGEFTSHHDHRMVMALKVASLGADSPIVIDDEACVSKSFPQFLDMFEAVERN